MWWGWSIPLANNKLFDFNPSLFIMVYFDYLVYMGGGGGGKKAPGLTLAFDFRQS